MLPDANPLINWLRFCRWLSLGRFLLTLSIPLWLTLFIHGVSPEGFLNLRQGLTVFSAAFLCSGCAACMACEEDSRYWEKRNARYQKLIDEVRELEND